MITKDFLHEILDYDQETGVFRWKKRTSMSIKVGDIAGRAYKVGYRVIKIKRVLYLAHRLAWLYMKGEWPNEVIDHINGVRDDNRLSNLRSVSRSVNAQNQKKATASNKAGLLGVSKKDGRYRAQITLNKKSTHIGCYDNPIDAYEACLSKKREIHEGCTI